MFPAQRREFPLEVTIFIRQVSVEISQSPNKLIYLIGTDDDLLVQITDVKDGVSEARSADIFF